MKISKLQCLVFMALCCSMGIFAKKLIAPVANMITDFLRIPGGIGTGFSLMFLVIAAVFVRKPSAAALMGAVQSVIAVFLGTVGSMGALAPIGYIIPGIVIDTVIFVFGKMKLSRTEIMIIANSLGAASASVTANFIVFGLRGVVLVLYLCVSLLFGALFGFLGSVIAKRLEPVFRKGN
ncbi:MAG: ECF transporter S component [Clostridia bacterium]|nr:ECF transporter S component [Clostridia bacterium]